MTGLDQAEFQKLAELVETFARQRAQYPKVNSLEIYTPQVTDAQERMAQLEQEGALDPNSRDRKQSKDQENMAIAVMVARETKLNHAEREIYVSFLQKDYFTRQDFGQLEQFYSHSYDKLTQEGQEEVSHRVWEGVRRGEYQFTELPDRVKAKESERLFSTLRQENGSDKQLQKIPESSRTEFLQAYENGHDSAAYEVIARPELHEHIAILPQTITSSTVSAQKEDLIKKPSAPDQHETPDTLKDYDFSSLPMRPSNPTDLPKQARTQTLTGLGE